MSCGKDRYNNGWVQEVNVSTSVGDNIVKEGGNMGIVG